MATVRLIGHHGTLAEYVDDITKNGFKARYNDEHWLGQGVYFYENNYGEAYGWACCKPHSQDVAVIEAEIVIEEEKFADFDNRETMRKLIKFAGEFLREGQDDDAGKRIVLGENRKANTCLLYDSFAKCKGISVMKKSFENRMGALQDLQQTYDIKYTPIQICVKDSKYINIQKISYVRKKKYEFRHMSKESSSCAKKYSI